MFHSFFLVIVLYALHLRARIQEVLTEGSNFDNVFFSFNEGRERIQIKAGPYRPASETPFKWRFAGVSIMAKH